ncbi:hypothetical protein Acsp05_16980 [Actinokineospora sp. NBRC 105648]|nr:hypothetical protein Acsp05_16980 [Actinokineospora sp. NBRC 105648]
MAAARTPRTPVALQGPKPSSAHTVPGKLKEKATTPSAASSVPLDRAETRRSMTALLLDPMSDSSNARAVADTP